MGRSFQALPSPAEARLIRALGRVSGHLLVKRSRLKSETIFASLFPKELTVVRLLCVLFLRISPTSTFPFQSPKIKPFNAHRYLRWEGIEKDSRRDCRKPGWCWPILIWGQRSFPLHCLGLRFPSVHQIGGRFIWFQNPRLVNGLQSDGGSWNTILQPRFMMAKPTCGPH